MDPVQLTGLAADVDPQRVHALLINRAPGLLEEGAPDHALFQETVRGVTSEVTPVVGPDPAPGQVRDLAVWCITLGVAAHLESALFPEQQFGDDSRAAQLHRRYLGVLSQLRKDVGKTAPKGSFPAAQPWPDPITGQSASPRYVW
jgi:hypothetical protein